MFRKPLLMDVRDASLAEFIGFFLGDGYLDSGRLVICVKEYEKRYILPLMELLGDVKIYQDRLKGNRTVQLYRLVIGSRNLVENWIDFKHKKIPLWFYEKDSDYRARILSGMFEAEGSVCAQGGYNN